MTATLKVLVTRNGVVESTHLGRLPARLADALPGAMAKDGAQRALPALVAYGLRALGHDGVGLEALARTPVRCGVDTVGLIEVAPVAQRAVEA
ncbi:hypothetical protein KIF24_20540 [Micromonospora sp. Llam7]|uniref:hypothetical protein n=1 Tax=Micromonospora tarapacensis TaxID=2835305 RepID=UPI001C835C99|nr:hypothetical protein [Micromonospora tarapacensis]MBX7268179.1 hypothetical protein [Micromonospora tarapacensis]